MDIYRFRYNGHGLFLEVKDTESSNSIINNGKYYITARDKFFMKKM